MEEYLKRIADSLERAFPLDPDVSFFNKGDAFIWESVRNTFSIVEHISTVDISLLKGMAQEIEKVKRNTDAFIAGNEANNVLVWGARGMGKSTLIKSVFKSSNSVSNDLKIIEVPRDNISEVNSVLKLIKNINKKFIIFCDDISFDDSETNYKSLKSVLDGGLIGGAENALIYATSNRRHLLSRKASNDQNYMRWEEELDERLSISDRFGISIGIYECDQDLFLEIVQSYAKSFGIKMDIKELNKKAIEWQVQRGSRSGRVAKQFVISLLGVNK